MSTLRLGFGLFTTGAVLLAVAAAACATTDSADANTGTREQVVPDADAPTADAGAPGDACADAVACAPVVDCSQVDVCPVAFPVSTLVGLNAVWGSGPDDVWAVGTRGTILHGDGKTFAPVAPASIDIYFSVWGTSKSDVWVVGQTAPLHSSGFVNGGASFDAVTGSSWNADSATSGRIWSGYSRTANDVWLGGETSSRFGSPSSFWELGTDTDGGAIWNGATACNPEDFCSPAVRALWGSGTSALWAVGSKGQVYRLDPPDPNAAAGTPSHWSVLNPNTNIDFEALWGTSDDDLWVIGRYGHVFHVTSQGTVWTEVPSSTNAHLHAIWGSGPSDVWAVGDDGAVIHYDGKAWSSLTVGWPSGDTPARLQGIWGSGPNDVWIVGQGVILHRTEASRRLP